MLFCPYYNRFFRQGPPYSYIRVFHAAPDAPTVDVYVDNTIIVSNVRFKGFSNYIKVSSGKHKVEVFRRGTKNNPLISSDLIIPESKILTLAAIGIMPNLDLKAIEDTLEPLRPGRTKVRFVHLSPGAPAVDITLSNGDIIFKDVSYGEVTRYKEIRPGNYNFQVRVAGTDKKVLLLPNTRFRPNRFYTIYAVGLVSREPKLQVLIPLDGNTYLKF
ncbi:DUF4397 domain-containing protein [Clostridium sp. P21]|uniref:DUF4397 domain-containing protein n=1 Tax=Clostridium muellerianum TaxID=2716538 RepID=A0A7Y0EHY9_9CLOT|nr:DUF4397 domain-containing protein [Clostridium muellerianum]NMM63815.1 DUF4397 domain-containing protein [Clostridium muellerianum]